LNRLQIAIGVTETLVDGGIPVKITEEGIKVKAKRK
jgi:hypothetical protein